MSSSTFESPPASQTTDEPLKAEFLATVVTGFELMSMDEIREKLAGEKVIREHGRVLFTTSMISEVLSLRSVDNIYVIVESRPLPTDIHEKEDMDKHFMEIIPTLDWRSGLTVWRELYSFERGTVVDILSREESDRKPKFRVTCNRTGNHKYASMDIACWFGGCLNELYRWPVSLKDHELDVQLFVREADILVCLALTKKSLHFRNMTNFGVTTLRSTICYNMLRLASIKPGDVICDPMCGSGSIPLEAALNWPDAIYLAGENNSKAIKNTAENVRALGVKNILITKHDTRFLPLRVESVDIFISDLPFGKRLGSKSLNQTLYAMFMAEMARCARLGSGRAILLTQDRRNMNRCIETLPLNLYWKLFRAVNVNIGGLSAVVYCMSRTYRPFDDKDRWPIFKRREFHRDRPPLEGEPLSGKKCVGAEETEPNIELGKSSKSENPTEE